MLPTRQDSLLSTSVSLSSHTTDFRTSTEPLACKRLREVSEHTGSKRRSSRSCPAVQLVLKLSTGFWKISVLLARQLRTVGGGATRMRQTSVSSPEHLIHVTHNIFRIITCLWVDNQPLGDAARRPPDIQTHYAVPSQQITTSFSFQARLEPIGAKDEVTFYSVKLRLDVGILLPRGVGLAWVTGRASTRGRGVKGRSRSQSIRAHSPQSAEWVPGRTHIDPDVTLSVGTAVHGTRSWATYPT